MQKVNIVQKFSLFDDYFNARSIGELNRQEIRITKMKGNRVWHFLENEDELLWVIKGILRVELKDELIILEAGEFLIVPRGVEHWTTAEDEVHLLMFEPASTVETENINDGVTVVNHQRI